MSGGREAPENYSTDRGLSVIGKYARMFGLGEASGLEIPEYDPQISNMDPVRTAIGQATNSYSPSHLARYAATVANRGNCYYLTLLDKLEKTDGTLIEDYAPRLYNRVEAKDSTWDAVQEGMRMVGENTTALSEIGIPVAGKTGTAQQSLSHPNHGVFISYAPYENPQIAVAARIANGYTPAYVVEMVADIYKYYFNLAEKDTIVTGTASGSTGQNIAD